MAIIERHEVNGGIRYEITIPEPWFTWFKDKKIQILALPYNSTGFDQLLDECVMPGVKIYFTNESNTVTIYHMSYYHNFGGENYRSFKSYVMDNGLHNILGYGPYNYARAERLYHNAYNDTNTVHCFKYSYPRN